MSKYHIKCTETDVPPKNKKKRAPPEPPKEDTTGLLASINPDRPCCCEVMSRALSDDLPKILGMSDRRAELQFGPDDLPGCNPDIRFDDTGESTNKDSERAKPPKGK